MSRTIGTANAVRTESSKNYDIALWYDSKLYKFDLLSMLAVAAFWVWYQRYFAYSHGVDSMEPEFDRVWMGLWRIHMVLMPLFALVTWG